MKKKGIRAKKTKKESAAIKASNTAKERSKVNPGKEAYKATDVHGTLAERQASPGIKTGSHRLGANPPRKMFQKTILFFFFFGVRRGRFIEMELSTWRPQASFLESQDWRRRFKCTCYYLPLRQLDTIVEFFHHAGSPRPRLPSRSAGGSWPRTSWWSCATSGPCHATSSCRTPGHKVREAFIVK